MAKLVVKQSAKAHGPLVRSPVHPKNMVLNLRCSKNGGYLYSKYGSCVTDGGILLNGRDRCILDAVHDNQFCHTK